MINLVNVRKSFGELEVLKNINLQIHEKEFMESLDRVVLVNRHCFAVSMDWKHMIVVRSQ